MSAHDTTTRRRFLGGGVALAAGGLGLSACGGSSSSSVPKGWTAVTFMSIGDAHDQQMFKSMIAAAQKESLDKQQIKIIWKPAPGDDWARTVALFASGTAADITRMDDDRVFSLALDKKIWQLDPWMLDKKDGMNKDDYYDTFWTDNTVEGYQFCMEPAMGANVLYYNKDLFKKAGIVAPKSWKQAWGWGEFVTNVKKLTVKSGNRTSVYGIGVPANIVEPMTYGTGDTALNADQTECGLTTPETAASIDAMVELVRNGYSPTVDIEQLPLFNSGKLAMGWGISVPEISTSIKWDIMPWPKSPLYATTKNYARAFVIPKTAKEPKAAYLALKALCGQGASDIIAKEQWAVPNFKKSAEGAAFTDHATPATKGVWAETLSIGGAHPVMIRMPRGPIGLAWADAFVEGTLANGLMSGKMKTDDYIKRGRKIVNAEIAKEKWNVSKGVKELQSSGSLADADKKVVS
jgi:ABC-type glycerol-3-phosphate transport system substrate-binding protein